MSESNHQTGRLGRYGYRDAEDESEAEEAGEGDLTIPESGSTSRRWYPDYVISPAPAWTGKHWFRHSSVFMARFISPFTGLPEQKSLLASSLQIRPNGFLWVKGLMKFYSSRDYSAVFWQVLYRTFLHWVSVASGFAAVLLSIWLSASVSRWFSLLSLAAPVVTYLSLLRYSSDGPDFPFAKGDYGAFTRLARVDRRFFRVALRSGVFTIVPDEFK